jgi:hypothetical protein
VSHSTLPTLAPTTAELLAAFPRIFSNERVSLRDLFRVLGDRGLASALLLLALPQMLPLPLGISNLLAIPAALVAVQMAMGRHTLWLPEWFLERPVRRKRLIQATGRVVPWLQRLEMLVRPRFIAVLSPLGAHIIGVICAIVAAIALAPLPLTGWLPGLALIVTALGMMERDGLVVLVGVGLGGAAMIVFTVVIGGLIQMGDAVADMAFAL